MRRALVALFLAALLLATAVRGQGEDVVGDLVASIDADLTGTTDADLVGTIDADLTGTASGTATWSEIERREYIIHAERGTSGFSSSVDFDRLSLPGTVDSGESLTLVTFSAKVRCTSSGFQSCSATATVNIDGSSPNNCVFSATRSAGTDSEVASERMDCPWPYLTGTHTVAVTESGIQNVFDRSYGIVVRQVELVNITRTATISTTLTATTTGDITGDITGTVIGTIDGSTTGNVTFPPGSFNVEQTIQNANITNQTVENLTTETQIVENQTLMTPDELTIFSAFDTWIPVLLFIAVAVWGWNRQRTLVGLAGTIGIISVMVVPLWATNVVLLFGLLVAWAHYFVEERREREGGSD